MTGDIKAVQEIVDIGDEKITIFEYGEDTDICHEAHDQKGLSPRTYCIFYHDTCYIVYDDRKDEDENINRNKEHVKDATGYEQVQPPEAMGQQEIDDRD